MNIKNRRFKIVKRTIVVLSIIVLLLIHFFVPRLITEIRNPVVSLIKRNKPVEVGFTTTNQEILRKKLFIPSFDGIKLSAHLTYASAKTPKSTIILLHGIRSSKTHFLELSAFLSENGYNSVAIDLRAHGESEGQFCTFGVAEKKDIKSVIDYLIEKENFENIGIWGQSLGGAVALQAMGFDQRIKFGIIESTFTDFKTIVNDYFDLHAGFSFKPFSDYLANRAARIADFDADDAHPIKYCENIDQPILIVHGNKDKRIDVSYGKANFSKLKSANKAFLEINNATHLNVWEVGGDKYFSRVIEFLNKN
ncbi:alpha/beta hydrolase [Winogradskyella sp.]|uniref:alpha/beta hydrolase n=1 Tax=Winogradskyella sp. TaxID=1883156 RepID=UPI0026266D07|nr:alpha/beta hydrolase [Winogradskyella sp.]